MMSQENNIKEPCPFCMKGMKCQIFDAYCVGCCARKVIRARPEGREYQNRLISDLCARGGHKREDIIAATKRFAAPAVRTESDRAA